MIATSLLLALSLSPAATPQIYQCRDAQGRASYQDKPCESARDQVVVEGGEQALRRWLEQQRQAEAAKRPATAAERPSASTPARPDSAPLRSPMSVTPREERLIAMCSERFLHCARGGDKAIDACIAALPRCGSGSGSGACCPATCIERYRHGRERGEAPSSAVYGALLDPAAPSCAAAN